MFISTHGFAAVIGTWGAATLGPWPELGSPVSLGAALVMGTLPDVPVALLIAAGRFDKARHRHHPWVTHTPAFWLLCGALVSQLVSPRWGIHLGACALIHLGTDWFGGGDGIPYLWPLTKRQFGVGLTGSHDPKTVKHYFTTGYKGLVESGIRLVGLGLLGLSLL